MIELTDGKITVDVREFNVANTLECGQIFRYTKSDNGDYGVYSTDKYAKLVTHNDGSVTIYSDDAPYFYDFFDFGTDYAETVERVSQRGGIIEEAAQFGRGIRILNQNLTETIFSFIISANNNIKRIQLIIERLCEALGKKTVYGYAFPDIKSLAEAGEETFARLGAGYRARYLDLTAKALMNFDLSSLKKMPTKEARRTLTGFYGIGEKVADCILLFGLNRKDVFPVDTWMKKVYHENFEQGHKDKDISSYLCGLFKEDAGIIQQYLFYFRRKYGQTA